MAIIIGHLVGQDPRLGRTGRALTHLEGQKQARGGEGVGGQRETKAMHSQGPPRRNSLPRDADILQPSIDGSKPLLYSARLGSLLLDGCQGERTGSEKLWGSGIGSQVERLE